MKTNRLIRTLAVLLCMVSMLTFSGMKQEIYAGSRSGMIVLNTYSRTMNIGDEYRLLAVPLDGRRPTFASSDTKVATVDAFGLIKAKKAGSVKITAKTKSGSATCLVTVNRTIIRLNRQYVSLDNGKTFRIKADVSNGHAVRYKSNKRSVATVDANGLVTAKSPGEAVITVSADNTSITCRIKVKKPDVILSQRKAVLYRKQKLQLTVRTSSTTKPKYRSSRSSVASVDANGCVTAMKHGTAVITATVDGVSKTCEITVRQPTVKFATDSIELTRGQHKRVLVKVSSGNRPVYTSSNEKVATVAANGMITAVGKGRAYIYATEDGVKAKLTVIVK